MKIVWFRLALLLPLAASAQVERQHINFDWVRQFAVDRAARPYTPPAETPTRRTPELVSAYNAIHFRPERALWRADGLPFQLQFFHPDVSQRDAVILHEFSATHDQVIPFVSDFFEYPATPIVDRLPASAGYGGFRVHYPLNRPDHFDELIVFHGGCSFRALAAGQAFGLTARALTLDAGPVLPEEFPRFTEFWIGRPVAGATTFTVYGLLESRRSVGAAEFVVTPGPTTTVAVRLSVILRATVAQPGFAPLSGMFWYGENSDRPPGEPRPEVHEVDGLAVHLGDGTALWRPLQNPANPYASGLSVDHLKGFGLVQRDRVFEHYGDLDADYHRRPSAWIEPVGDWGPGRIQLVELPAHTSFEANVTAFWLPDQRPRPGVPFTIQYRIQWTAAEPEPALLARVVATHIGALADPPLSRLFWIDFAGTQISREDNGSLDAEVQVSPGATLLRHSVRKNPADASWRVALEVQAQAPGRAVELRCGLRRGYTPVGETWFYSWTP